MCNIKSMKLLNGFKKKIQDHFKLIDFGIISFLFIITLANRFWLLPNIATHVFRGIPNIYTWMALWNCRVLDTLNFSMYWTSNAMFPYPNAFAFSENMIGFTPFVYPIWKITGNPVLTINLLSLLLLWLTAVITYFILKSFKINRFAALIGTLIFSFYPWVLKMSSLGRFHMQGIMWLPVIVWANCKFWQTGKKKYLFMLSFFWLWTFLISLYLGIFLAVFIGTWNLTWFFYERELFSLKKIAKWCAAVLLVWILMIPVFLVYNQVSSDMGVVRSLENQVQYTGDIWSWFTTTDENWLWGQTIRFLPGSTRDGIIENFIFPGFICLVLFTAGFFIKQMPIWLKSLKWTTISLIILAIGPYTLGIPWKIPMPFTLLWYIFPPLKATRNPHRLGVFVLLCFAFLAAYVLTHISIKKKIPLVFKILLIFAILLETFNYVKPQQAVKRSTPLIYEELKEAAPSHTVIELPMSTAVNLKALTFSAFHWNRIINGSSNYWPPLLGQLERELKRFPSDHTIQLLQALSVDRIILHESKYSQEQKIDLIKKLKQRPGLKFIKRIAGKSLWSLEKGEKFISFNPGKHLELSGPSKLVEGDSILSLDIPAARGAVIFNRRAPFQSRFLSSKKWYITPLSFLTGNIQKPMDWKSPALFHRHNWRKKVWMKVASGDRDVGMSIDIMGDSIHLTRKVTVVEAEKTSLSLPSYFSLPKGFKEISPGKLRVKLTPGLRLVKKGLLHRRLEGYVEVSNPGPYYWSAGKNNGIYLGIKIKKDDQPDILSYNYNLPHDLFPGDKTKVYISVPLARDFKTIQISMNCFGRSKPGEFKWFPEENMVSIPEIQP